MVIGVSLACVNAPDGYVEMLKIRSRAGAGTEVELRVPADIAFERPATRRAGTWITSLKRKIHDRSSVETTENRS